MNSSLRKLAILLFASACLALITTGCQTSQGFGEDVEDLGDEIQDAAN